MVLFQSIGALPDNLLESELFGHEQGAFTDAKRLSRGLIAQAEGGTLFFDEIETMTPRAQVVLLRFLQDHHYRSVGGRVTKLANVRIVAASNADMEEMVRRKEFRADLLFRFGVLRVTMPALRYREGDVILLTQYFRARFAAQYGRPASPLDPGMVARLRAYDWPGNVREVENLALRQILLDDPEEAQFGTGSSVTGSPDQDDAFADPTLRFRSAKAEAVAQFEKAYLCQLLARTGGNISEAAKLCGKDRSTLNKLVRKHRLMGGVNDARTYYAWAKAASQVTAQQPAESQISSPRPFGSANVTLPLEKHGQIKVAERRPPPVACRKAMPSGVLSAVYRAEGS